MNAHANPYLFNTNDDVEDLMNDDDFQQLPSRDIPSNTAEYIQDEEVLVNYIERDLTDPMRYFITNGSY